MGRRESPKLNLLLALFDQFSGVGSLNFSQVMDKYTRTKREPSPVLATMSPVRCQTARNLHEEGESILSFSVLLFVCPCLPLWLASQSGSWLSVSLIMNSRSCWQAAGSSWWLPKSQTRAVVSCHPPPLTPSGGPDSRREVMPTIRIRSWWNKDETILKRTNTSP